ncbi:MAG: hypothetical protein L7H00_04410, partial [Vulcanisaeta sp.]|nr:hypothetical protein [Vulcanisaeta sp.]
MYVHARGSDGTGTMDKNSGEPSISILYDVIRTEERLLINEFKAFNVRINLVNIDELSLDV